MESLSISGIFKNSNYGGQMYKTGNENRAAQIKADKTYFWRPNTTAKWLGFSVCRALFDFFFVIFKAVILDFF